MKDTRYFAKIDVGYFDNPKIALLVDDDLLVVVLHMRAILYCCQHLTEGLFPIRTVARMVGATWCGAGCSEQCSEQSSEQCSVCKAVHQGLFEWCDTPGHARVHDYLKHQESSTAVQARKDKARRGADARWGRAPTAPSNAPSNAPSIARSSAPSNADEMRGEESNKSTPRAASPDRFEEFWDLYPKKAAKGDARRAWTKAVKATDATVIIEALRAQLPWFASQLKPDGDFRPGAGPWLNQERWTDEIAQPAQLMTVGNYDAYRDAPRPSRPVFHDDD